MRVSTQDSSVQTEETELPPPQGTQHKMRENIEQCNLPGEGIQLGAASPGKRKEDKQTLSRLEEEGMDNRSVDRWGIPPVDILPFVIRYRPGGKQSKERELVHPEGTGGGEEDISLGTGKLGGGETTESRRYGNSSRNSRRRRREINYRNPGRYSGPDITG